MEQVAVSVLTLMLMGCAAAIILQQAARRFEGDSDSVVDAINECLPQTQCAQCGYPGCKPYAEAIAAGDAINKCPPGGETTIATLSNLLGRQALPLDPDYGEENPPSIAVIREDECIGCTLCIKACPVDAIVGAPQLMHTIIESECTGCELCLAPCPVDCIDLIELEPPNEVKSTVASSSTAGSYNDCIRCGICETACPKQLSPQDLFWYRESQNTLDELDLDACILCSRCDRVCPSGIPLTETFESAKLKKQETEMARTRAERASTRYSNREQRLKVSGTRVRKRPGRNETASLLDALREKS